MTIKTKKPRQPKPASAPSPIMARADDMARAHDRADAYERVVWHLEHGGLSYGGCTALQARHWVGAAHAEAEALREAVMRADPASLADAAVMAAVAACELDSMNACEPLGGEDYKRAIASLYAAVGSVAWTLARHCKGALPEAFKARYGRDIEVCRPHGPPVDELPTLPDPEPRKPANAA